MSWVGELRAFVEACKKDPALLVDPSLAFFRDYLTSLGADLHAAAAAKSGPKVPTHPTPLISVPINEEDGTDMRDPTVETDELDEDIVESDLELEGDVVQPDHSDAPQKMGDPSFEVTEESRDASQKEKGMATEAISEGSLVPDCIRLDYHFCFLIRPCVCVCTVLIVRETARSCRASYQGNPPESNLCNDVCY